MQIGRRQLYAHAALGVVAAMEICARKITMRRGWIAQHLFSWVFLRQLGRILMMLLLLLTMLLLLLLLMAGAGGGRSHWASLR